jgi:hypothetical protein
MEIVGIADFVDNSDTIDVTLQKLSPEQFLTEVQQLLTFFTRGFPRKLLPEYFSNPDLQQSFCREL